MANAVGTEAVHWQFVRSHATLYRLFHAGRIWTTIRALGPVPKPASMRGWLTRMICGVPPPGFFRAHTSVGSALDNVARHLLDAVTRLGLDDMSLGDALGVHPVNFGHGLIPMFDPRDPDGPTVFVRPPWAGRVEASRAAAAAADDDAWSGDSQSSPTSSDARRQQRLWALSTDDAPPLPPLEHLLAVAQEAVLFADTSPTLERRVDDLVRFATAASEWMATVTAAISSSGAGAPPPASGSDAD